jgi:hypothetical protein
MLYFCGQTLFELDNDIVYPYRHSYRIVSPHVHSVVNRSPRDNFSIMLCKVLALLLFAACVCAYEDCGKLSHFFFLIRESLILDVFSNLSILMYKCAQTFYTTEKKTSQRKRKHLFFIYSLLFHEETIVIIILLIIITW